MRCTVSRIWQVALRFFCSFPATESKVPWPFSSNPSSSPSSDGTARDVSFLVDFIPSYLFSHDERAISKWAVTGKSLGGHSAWMVLGRSRHDKTNEMILTFDPKFPLKSLTQCRTTSLSIRFSILPADDPRVSIGCPMIGMPDYNRLLAYRTRSSFVANAPPTVPNSLKSLISRIDREYPSSINWVLSLSFPLFLPLLQVFQLTKPPFDLPLHSLPQLLPSPTLLSLTTTHS